MGKNNKNKKKMKGAEKTNLKTEKKLLLKQKKMLAKIGEADIEDLLAKYKVDPTKKEVPSVEVDCPAPSPRVNFCLVTHPTKDQLIFHGGEFFDGQKSQVFDDLFFYTIGKDSWSVLRCGEKPLPRCGHQMVATATDGGQLWLFGGEYSSPSQLQFHHYSDLWVFRLKTRQWERIAAPGNPSARSGHRMLLLKKRLFVFGGFHDNNQSYKYFNDVHFFSLDDYRWSKVDVAGVAPPPPRSGCCMAATSAGSILVWGGYSKSAVKKDADKGTTHWDSYSLTPDKHDPKGLIWKWVSVKMGGMRPPPRSGISFVVAPNGRLYTFGGVMDTEEDEENIKGQFTDELHSFDPETRAWRRIDVTSKKKSHADEDASMQDKVVTTAGAFTVTVGADKPSRSSQKSSEAIESGPSARSHCGMAVCKGTLFVFGGTIEEGSRDMTLGDFYSLDLQKPTAWRTIIANKSSEMEWNGSESEESNSEDSDHSDDQESSDSDDSDSDMDTN